MSPPQILKIYNLSVSSGNTTFFMRNTGVWLNL